MGVKTITRYVIKTTYLLIPPPHLYMSMLQIRCSVVMTTDQIDGRRLFFGRLAYVHISFYVETSKRYLFEVT